MGEMTDYALEIAQMEQEHFDRHRDAPIQKQYKEGLVDKNEVTIGNPTRDPALPPSRRVRK